MLNGTVESISRTSVVVSTGGKAATLTGPAVEAMVSDLKIGDSVEFDNAEKVTKFGKAKKTKSAPAERRNSSSPNPAAQTKIDF